MEIYRWYTLDFTSERPYVARLERSQPLARSGSRRGKQNGGKPTEGRSAARSVRAPFKGLIIDEKI